LGTKLAVTGGRVGIGTVSPRQVQDNRWVGLEVASATMVADDVFLSNPLTGSPRWASQGGGFDPARLYNLSSAAVPDHGGVVSVLPGGRPEKGSLEEALLARPGKKASLDLSGLDTAWTCGLSEKQALKKLRKDQQKLDLLEQKLYAEGKRRVLVVLQAMDSG